MPGGGWLRAWEKYARDEEHECNLSAVRETDLPSAETTFQLIHCLLLSLLPLGCLRKKGEKERERNGSSPRRVKGMIVKVRRFGESKKYYIINTDPRVQWGRWGSTWSAPFLIPFCRFSNHPEERTVLPLFFLYAKATRFFPRLTFASFHSLAPVSLPPPSLSARGTLGIYILIIWRALYTGRNYCLRLIGLLGSRARTTKLKECTVARARAWNFYDSFDTAATASAVYPTDFYGPLLPPHKNMRPAYINISRLEIVSLLVPPLSLCTSTTRWYVTFASLT